MLGVPERYDGGGVLRRVWHRPGVRAISSTSGSAVADAAAVGTTAAAFASSARLGGCAAAVSATSGAVASSSAFASAV